MIYIIIFLVLVTQSFTWKTVTLAVLDKFKTNVIVTITILVCANVLCSSKWRTFPYTNDITRIWLYPVVIPVIWVQHRYGRLWYKVGQISPKWENLGLFQIRFQTNTSLWFEKVPHLSHLGPIWPVLWPKTDISGGAADSNYHLILNSARTRETANISF